MPTFTFGSNVTNAYIQIAQLLRRATYRPPPLPTQAPTITPSQEPRVPIQPTQPQPPVPAQPPSTEPRVLPIPTSVPTAVPPPKKARTTIRRPTRYGPLPHLRPRGWYVTRYGRAIDTIQLAQHAEQYAHHIKALATLVVEKGKEGSIQKLLKGPEAKTWDRGRANEWGRLLPHGVGVYRPDENKIKGTGMVFFIKKALSQPTTKYPMQILSVKYDLIKKKLTM